MSNIFQNYVDGSWCNSSSGDTFADVNPADTNEVLGEFQQSNEEDMCRAIESAKAAFPKWRLTPAAERADILRKALALMAQREDEMAEVLTLENGKTLKESHTEIAAAYKEMEYQIAEGVRLCGETKPSQKDGVFCYSVRQPLGVVGILTPWNFPFNVVSRKVIPAMMAGNTVVFKPASFTPWTGLVYTQLLVDAGLPAGVFNLVTGRGAEVGDVVVQSPDVKAISFTGSTEVGRGIERTAVAHGARVQLEMGGKNPTVIMDDADLDEAAAAVVTAAYACAGQWCTSTSRAVVIESIADEFTSRVLDKVAEVVVGGGMDPNTTMGPVAGHSQLKSILQYLDIGKAEGARLLVGGGRCNTNGCDKGTFVEPTVFTNVTPDMRIAQDEIFGPALSIMTAKSLEEAIEISNSVDYGLCSSIFTNNLSHAMTFIENTHVGLTHVNMPTAHKEVQLEFGGIKDSGAGPPEAGHAGIEFFCEHKVAYIKYR